MKGVFQKDCPQCKAKAVSLSPVKATNERAVVFICTNKKCSHAFKVSGGAFVKDADELTDVFKAGKMANEALDRVLLGEKVNPSTRALLMANIVEYGMNMWQDGLKTGLVINAIKQEANMGVYQGKQQDRGDRPSGGGLHKGDVTPGKIAPSRDR